MTFRMKNNVTGISLPSLCASQMILMKLIMLKKFMRTTVDDNSAAEKKNLTGSCSSLLEIT